MHPSHAQLRSFAQTLNTAELTPVEAVYRQAAVAIGWPETLLAQWEALPDEAVSKAGWQAVVYRTGLDLAKQAESDTELAYHNRTHTAEVILSGALLANAEYESAQERANEGLKLLTVAAGHDLEHEGYAPGLAPGAMEAHSARMLVETFQRYGNKQSLVPLREQMRHAILGTEFMHGPKSNAQALAQAPGHASTRLAVLANEADILPSLLPWTGQARGHKLAQEWADKAHPGAATVASEQGRLGFLKSLPLASHASRVLGLDQLREEQIAALSPVAPVQPVQPSSAPRR